jgi:hypothetical protein
MRHNPQHYINSAEVELEHAFEGDHDQRSDLAHQMLGLRSTLITCTQAIVAAIQENHSDRPG